MYRLFIFLVFSFVNTCANAIDTNSIEKLSNKKILKPQDNTETFTYIKCSYKKNQNLAYDTTSSWVWGETLDSKGEYAKVKGRWYSNAILTNLFYTKTSQQKILDICKNTLNKKNIRFSDLIPYASDYNLSYYYTFWHEGDDHPVVNINNRVVDRMVVFGDSLSDTSNVYNGSYGTVPNSKYWYLGHFTNGLVWHEYLSRNYLKVPSYSWATGNAESRKGNIFSGFSQQLDSFESYISNATEYKIGETLFLVLFGGNDIINRTGTPTSIINNYKTSITKLLNMGAKNIALLNLPDLSAVPSAAKLSKQEKLNIKKSVEEFNIQLINLVMSFRITSQDTKLIILDLNSAFSNIMVDKEKYGFKNINDSCLKLKLGSLSYISGATPNDDCKANNANYIFWDNIHPTTKTHEVLSSFLKKDLLGY